MAAPNFQTRRFPRPPSAGYTRIRAAIPPALRIIGDNNIAIAFVLIAFVSSLPPTPPLAPIVHIIFLRAFSLSLSLEWISHVAVQRTRECLIGKHITKPQRVHGVTRENNDSVGFRWKTRESLGEWRGNKYAVVQKVYRRR